MIFQIFYIALYVGLDSRSSETKPLNSYDIFNAAILLWLALFCLIFLWNSLRRFMISELKIAIICFTVMNVFTTMRYSISLANIKNEHNGDVFGKDGKSKGKSINDVFDRMLYVMDFLGIGFNVVLLIMYCVVTYFVYTEMRQFILFHLDGNRIMWENFQEITTTRGILKLDVLANLEFFTSFLFILLQDE